MVRFNKRVICRVGYPAVSYTRYAQKLTDQEPSFFVLIYGRWSNQKYQFLCWN